MTTTKRLFTLFIAMMFMLSVPTLAESDGTTEDWEQECHDQYNEDLADAERDYEEAKADEAEEADDRRADGSDAHDPNDTSSDADARYEEDKADAERDYEKCLAEAHAEESDRAAMNRTDEAPAHDRYTAECRAEYEEDLADAERDYHDDMADAKEDGDAEKEHDAMADYEEAKADAERDYEECLHDRDDDERGIDLPHSFEGSHIAFDLTRSGLRNYSIDDQDLLSSVSIHTAVGWDEYERHGASIKVEGDLAEFRVADNPTGVMQFETEHDKRIYITFADGVEAVRYTEVDSHHDRNGSVVEGRLLLRGDGFEAFLWVDKGFVQEERGIIADGEFRLAMVQNDRSDRAHDSRTVDAIADGRLAVEVDVARSSLRAAQYGDINITFENATDGLIATVEGHGEGKTILFNLDMDAYESLDELQVIYDGEEIGFADNLEDVLDISDGVAEYIIIVGAEATQVLVQVPHFSVHTIQLQGTTIGTSPAVAAMAIAIGGGAAAAFIAVTMMGRRRGD